MTSSANANGVCKDEDDSKNVGQKKMSKRARRKARQKELRRERREVDERREQEQNGNEKTQEQDGDERILDSVKDEVDVSYVPETLDESVPLVAEFAHVFKKFQHQPKTEAVEEKSAADEDADMNDESSEEDEDDAIAKLSNKELKKRTRLSVAELKQLVEHPEVVDIHDCNSSDPRLLVFLKSHRNLVPIPVHWSQKRKYLQGKRGIEKAPFALPDFIEATGIAKIRQAHAEADEQKKLKQRTRDRTAPKMNRIDIDYQVLHDAFFRHQTKPKMAGHGDIYFEGKEFQVQMLKQRPGHVSPRLREALGMVDGYPPPWLVNMQRFGPPPSYRSLRIAGLNAPLPAGASYGYLEGQWGKPPVDSFGMPLYGDPFGVVAPESELPVEPVDKTAWGEIEEEFEEEQVEESDQEDMEEEIPESGDAVSGMESVASMASGLETPDAIELRKAAGLETPDVDLRKNRQLYTVLEQQENQIGDALVGSSHTYKMPSSASGSQVVSRQLTGNSVDVSIAPEELEGLDDQALARKFQEEAEAVKALRRGDDLSDVMLEETRKRKRKEEASASNQKRYKDFKF